MGGNNDIGGYYRYWVSNMHKFSQQSFTWDKIYFIFHTMTLVTRWTTAWGIGGGWGGNRKSVRRREASKGQECFLVPLDYFSSGFRIPLQGSALDSSRNLNWLYCGLHPHHFVPLTSVAFQCYTGPGWEGGRAADMKCWNNSGTTTERYTRRKLHWRGLLVFLFEVTLHVSKWGNSSCTQLAPRTWGENQSSPPFLSDTTCKSMEKLGLWQPNTWQLFLSVCENHVS